MVALADVAVAAALTAGALGEVAALTGHAPMAAAVILSVAGTTCVAWRRRAPAASVLVAATAMLAYRLSTADPRMTFEPYAVALCYYLLGRQAPASHRRSVYGFLIGYGLVTLGFEFHGSAASRLLQTVAGWVVFVVLSFGLGVLAARYRSTARTLAATTARLTHEQDLRARRAAGEERTRVARELHDVLGHCVSVMVIQAGAASLVAETDPAGAGGALAAVEACGREALDDLRRIMGVTRRGDDVAGPVPGLAQLSSLAERATDAGVSTDLRVDGADVALPAAVDLACYRVVQEALTNVVKHAGPARAEVRVRVEAARVSITVADSVADTGAGSGSGPGSGPVPAPPGRDESGRGIIGLRERVALHGGWLRAAPRAGGFLVEAHIPLTADPSAGRIAPPPPPSVSGGPAARRRLSDLGRTWLDRLLACGWLVALAGAALTSDHRRGPLALNISVAAAMALAGLWRRRAPVAFLASTAVLSIPLSSGLTSRDYATLAGVYCVLVPPYAVGAWAKRPRAVAAIAIWGVGATVLGLTQHASLGGLAGPLLAAGAAWSAGVAVQAQRELTARLRAATTRLAAEREERERQAAAEERTRIARDLHLLVARSVVAMVVQAEAARELLGTRPADALTAITAIEAAGREALAEMRRILGVLRRPGEVHDLRPPAMLSPGPRVSAA